MTNAQYLYATPTQATSQWHASSVNCDIRHKTNRVLDACQEANERIQRK